jgi:hypothetical protein
MWGQYGDVLVQLQFVDCGLDKTRNSGTDTRQHVATKIILDT